MINLQEIKTGTELIVKRDILTKGIVAGQRAIVTRVDRKLEVPKATIQVLDADPGKESKVVRYDEKTINAHFGEVVKMKKPGANKNIRIDVKDVKHLKLDQVRDIYTNGKITVVILNGGYKGIAKCDIEHDEYDRDKGILIAYNRATIKANNREFKKTIQDVDDKIKLLISLKEDLIKNRERIINECNSNLSELLSK